MNVLTRDFVSHDLGLAASNLRKERDENTRMAILDITDTEKVIKRLMEILDIRNREEQSVGINDVHILEIKEYLTALDLIVDCPIETALPDVQSIEHILFTQPGMRYCQAQVLVYSLLKDAIFSALSEYEKKLVTDRIFGGSLRTDDEEIVLLESMKSTDKGKRVFKLQFTVGEFDIVIYDERENNCSIFEIKHSDKIVPEQYQLLIDEEKCRQTERRFGIIVKLKTA